MGALDLVAKAVKGGKKAAPFFSKADVLLDELQRGKGTGQEFLTELVKKGAKPTELRERGIEAALKDRPKMSKAEVQKIFEEKAPPKVQEKVLGPSPDYDEFLEAKAQELYGDDYWNLRKDEKARIDQMFNELGTAEYEQYKTPGGENYREILLKLPSFDDKRLMKLEADVRREEAAFKDPMQHQSFRDKVAEIQRLKEEKAAAGQPYVSSHYRQDPNLLAHIRVQDFQVPSKGFAVVNTRSGNKSEVFDTMEQAQEFLNQMPENMRGMLRIDEAAGKPKKVLLVDEVQSDWHQQGRKEGYKTSEDMAREKRRRELGEKIRRGEATTEEMNESDQLMREANQSTSHAVPDAPFKKNWHELAMKRVLDYAAENGYDTVAITPGAEQVKRYDLSKSIGSIAYDPQKNVLDAWDHNRRQVMRREINDPSQIEDYIGKEAASKLLQTEQTMGKHLLEGQDLQVGGEGMKGFYDKILPDYLNNYGKQYGAGIGQIDLITKPEKAIPQIAAPGIGHFPEPTIEPAQTLKAHSFDITPEMREAIKTKGQPLYSAMGAEGLAGGAGAATIGANIIPGEDEQAVQNPVHFTENPDAMRLELMQRK